MKKYDWLIILLVLVLAGGFFIGNRLMNSRFEKKQVEIISYGEIVYSEDLTNSFQGEFVIDNEHGYNRVIIDKGVVQMEEADCRDQVCVLSKPISNPGESIVCLPHQVIVRIIGAQTGEVDVISN
jgi:hypothetical protein